MSAHDELRADRDAILKALDVPKGVDSVEWAQACLRIVRAAAHWKKDEGTGMYYDELTRAVNAVRALLTPRRPRPYGPGWWWGQYDCDAAPRPYYVTRTDCGCLDLLDEHCPYGAGSVSAGNANWTWLAGPDGCAVRCTPPEAAP